MFDMEKKKSSDYTVTAIFIFMYFMIKITIIMRF